MSTPSSTQTVSLPKQFSSRPVTFDDVEAVIALGNSMNRAKGYDHEGAPDALLADWKEPDFILEDSSLAIENENGAIIAYATLWDNSVVPVRPFASWTLHDSLYGTEVEHFLLNWLEAKAQRVFDKCPPDLRVTLGTSALKGYAKRTTALEQAGFVHKRNFYRMSIEMQEAPPQAKLPANIIMRGMHYPDEIEEMAAAVEAGFQDHWGFVEEPLEEAVKFWTHYTETDRLFDPTLYFLAVDSTTDKIAGLVLCRMEQVGKPETAYVEELAVLPDYRRQGVALGMLHHAFGELYKRGRTKVALHVDADSLTGATRLYTRAGMHPVETWMNFQKVLREGIDISTTSLG